MKGDVLVIEEHHRRAAARLASELLRAVPPAPARLVVTVAGESGSGKSETATALSDELRRLTGLGALVLGQDDYFALPPRSNDARRREDPEWLGPHCEVRLDLLQDNLDAAREGATSIEKPLVDYAADSVASEVVALGDARVVVAEGTYVSLLRHVDCRVFIARSRLETREHRLRRNRGGEALDPFVESVLDTEHKIIAGHRHLADVVLTREFDVVRQR